MFSITSIPCLTSNSSTLFISLGSPFSLHALQLPHSYFFGPAIALPFLHPSFISLLQSTLFQALPPPVPPLFYFLFFTCHVHLSRRYIADLTFPSFIPYLLLPLPQSCHSCPCLTFFSPSSLLPLFSPLPSSLNFGLLMPRSFSLPHVPSSLAGNCPSIRSRACFGYLR